MANVSDKIAAIRQAVKGLYVRSSIADGIESINEEVENTTERQTTLENNMNSLADNLNKSESNRVNAENTRVSSEQSRASAESNRANEFNNMKNAYEAATHENTVVELTAARHDSITNTDYNDVGKRMDDHSIRINGSNFPTRTLDKLAAYSPTTIVCFGDSLTWGAKGGASVGTQVESPYPTHLQAWLNYYHNQSHVTVINSGNPGYRADQLVSLIDTQVLSHNPDCAVVMAGANEGIQNGPDYTTFRNSMTQIIEKCLKNNIEVILMATHQLRGIGSQRFLANLNSIVRALADQYKLALVDWDKEVDKYYKNKLLNPFDLLPDGVHLPDSKYYKLISDAIIYNYLYPHVIRLNIDETINLVSNPSVSSDCSIQTNPSSKLFKQTYNMKEKSQNSIGTKINFSIYNNEPDVSKFYLIGNKSSSGAKITYKINGNTIDTINFCNDINLNDAEFPLSLAPGLNEIEFDVDNTYVGDNGGHDISISGIGVKRNPIMYKKNMILQNNWTLTDTNKPLFYQKTASNEIVFSKVYISAYNGGIKADGTILFTMDYEDRPKQPISFTVPTEQGSSNTCTITFNTDGTCRLYGWGGTNWLLFDNVRFYLE